VRHLGRVRVRVGVRVRIRVRVGVRVRVRVRVRVSVIATVLRSTERTRYGWRRVSRRSSTTHVCPTQMPEPRSFHAWRGIRG